MPPMVLLGNNYYWDNSDSGQMVLADYRQICYRFVLPFWWHSLGDLCKCSSASGQLNRDQGVLGQVLNAGKKSAIFLKIGSLPCPISLPHTRALRTFVSLSDAGGRREKTREDPAAGMSHNKPLSHEEREPVASTLGRRWPGFVSMFLSFQVYWWIWRQIPNTLSSRKTVQGIRGKWRKDTR